MGAGIAKRFYRGRFLLGGVPQRAVQFMRHSPLFRAIMQDIFAGSQAYHNLKPRLWKNLTGTLRELAMSWTGGSARVK
jgi:hypothetical protein